VSSVNGQALWSALLGANGSSCADCHGAPKPDVVSNLLKINNAAGTAADQGIPSAIRRGIQNAARMTEFAAVSDADLADLAAYVNATTFTKDLTTGTGVAPTKSYLLWYNGATVTSVVMPTTAYGAVSTIKVNVAIQAPATASLHIDHMLLSGAMFTLNRVPVSATDKQSLVPGAVGAACPVGAFDLLPGEACGLEVILAISKPGVETAKLDIYTDPAQAPESVTIEASITAQATGGKGGGGCTLRQGTSLFDPMLLLMTALACLVMFRRRLHQKNQSNF
jgi:hypothetical protein